MKKKLNRTKRPCFVISKAGLIICLTGLLLLAPLKTHAGFFSFQDDKTEQSSLFQEQTKTVTGKVTDENGEPIPGASIVVKGTATGTITDINGNFSLSGVPSNAVLVFSFVGMKSVEVSVAAGNQFNMVLEQETLGLDEVVVVGYGTQ